MGSDTWKLSRIYSPRRNAENANPKARPKPCSPSSTKTPKPSSPPCKRDQPDCWITGPFRRESFSRAARREQLPLPICRAGSETPPDFRDRGSHLQNFPSIGKVNPPRPLATPPKEGNLPIIETAVRTPHLRFPNIGNKFQGLEFMPRGFQDRDRR